MAIVGALKCDFVVWTPKSIKVEMIPFDKALWENEMLPTLSLCDFYYKYMLPYIVYLGRLSLGRHVTAAE